MSTTTPESDVRRAKVLIGKRLKLVGKHPHAGATGVVKSIDHTAAGWGLLVQLDNPSHGETGCYVFHNTEISWEAKLQ